MDTYNEVKNIAVWMEEYEKNLAAQGVADAHKVAARNQESFERGSFNKDRYAVQSTCDAFGIPCTYAAINAFLAGK